MDFQSRRKHGRSCHLPTFGI